MIIKKLIYSFMFKKAINHSVDLWHICYLKSIDIISDFRLDTSEVDLGNDF